MEHTNPILFQQMHKIFARTFDADASRIYFGLSKKLLEKKLTGARILTITPDNIDDLKFNGNFSIKKVKFISLMDGIPTLPTLPTLPFGIEKVEFTQTFNSPIESIIPSTLTTLTYVSFGALFNQDISSLPESVRHIRMCERSNFNQEVDNLPPNLLTLHLGYYFDQSIDKITPSIKSLRFGSRFTQSIDNLPPNLTSLTLISSFPHDLTNLPSTLKYLSLSFYQGNLNDLPLGLKYLKLHDCGPISKFPPNLLRLKLVNPEPYVPRYFNYAEEEPVERVIRLAPLPQSLRRLSLGGRFIEVINDPHVPVITLPSNLKRLSIKKYFIGRLGTLPKSLKHLESRNSFISFLFSTNNLPQTLTHFECEHDRLYDFPTPLISLPLTMVHLTFSKYYDCSPFILKAVSKMTNLRHLSLGNTANQKIDNLPLRLTHLILGDQFNQTVNHLPSSLLILKLGNVFNQFIDNLPLSLVELTLGTKFNQRVDHLPPSLKILIFGDKFNQSVSNLPHGLKEITFGVGCSSGARYIPPPPGPDGIYADGTLGYWYGGNFCVGSPFNHSIDSLPKSVTRIIFCDSYGWDITTLPPNLVHLDFKKSYTKTLRVPQSLLFLRITDPKQCTGILNPHIKIYKSTET